MPLDPQVREYLKRGAEEGAAPINELSVAEARSQMAAKTALLGLPPEVARIEDRFVEGRGGHIPIRVYWPKVAEPESGWPILVYFHGGGWVLGNIETHDGLCRAIANECPTIVVSVEYRKAPEHPFPAAVEDAFAATGWAQSEAANLGGNPSRIAVGGDSAGGNLATVASILCRDRGGPKPVWQLLIYPATDSNLDSDSYQECASGFGLNRAEMAWFWDHYASTHAERIHPHASPLRAENLSDLPPAFILTAEYDVLRDEGENYAERLRDADVPTVLKRYDGMIHGFLRRYMFFDGGRTALEDIGIEMRRVIGAEK